MENITVQFILVVAACAFLIGLSKGGLGGTPGVLVTPMLTLIYAPPQAVAIALPMLMFGDIFANWAYWRKWDTRIIIQVLPGTIVGVIIGLILLRTLPADTVKHGIALFVLGFCLYKVFKSRLRNELASGETHPWQPHAFGFGTGIASALANAGGPIASMYLVILHLPPVPFIATSAIYFALINLMKLPVFLATGVLRLEAVWQILWVLPFVPMGVWTGRYMVNRINIKAFDKLILALLAISSFFLLVT